MTSEQSESILKNTGRPVVDTRNGLAFRRLDVVAAIAATPHVTPPPAKRRAARK